MVRDIWPKAVKPLFPTVLLWTVDTSSWMILYELDIARTIIDFKDDSGMKNTKHFTSGNIFGLHLRYRNIMEDHSNWINTPISLERTWATKFWTKRNFAWSVWTILHITNKSLFGVEISGTNNHFRANLAPYQYFPPFTSHHY